MAPLLPTSIDYLDLQSKRHPRKAALRYEDASLSYKQWSRFSTDIATSLENAEYGHQSRIGLLVPNNFDAAVFPFSIWSIGAIVVPLATRLTEDELQRLARAADLECLVSTRAYEEPVNSIAKALDISAFLSDPEGSGTLEKISGNNHHSRRCGQAPRPKDLAVIAFTSGTTGEAKGVMLTHSNLLWSTLACSTARRDCSDSVGTCLSPLSHTPVFVSHLLARVLHGSTSVLFQRFSVDSLIEAIGQHHISDLSLIAGMVSDFLGATEDAQLDFPSLRKISVGGAPTALSQKRKLAKLFAPVEIINAYGQSESTNGVAMTKDNSGLQMEGNVGFANPHVVVDIHREDGNSASPEEEGEIVISGPTVMKGYYRQPDATAETIRDGWLHTGDLGYKSPDGSFVVTGRLKEIIISGGENVSSAEVESVIQQHPDIKEVAVIGCDDSKWGEVVTACIVRRPGSGIDSAILAEFTGRQLAGFKKPRRFEFFEELPRNATNKVLKQELKRIIENGKRRMENGE